MEYYKTELLKRGTAQTKELDSLKTKLIDNVRLAQQLQDTGAVQSGVQQVWQQYASFSDSREKGLDFSLAQLTEKLLPPAHQYFIHAAEQGVGLCGPEEEKEGEEMSCTDEFNFGRKESDHRKDSIGDKLAEIVKLKPEELELIRAKREAIATIAESIRTKVKKITEDKTEVAKEIKELDKIIQESFFSKLSPDAAIEFIEWIDAV